ncbi:MAG: hypothetical protein J6Y94_00445, partial [Bacteriovoracaceae bacterium]|nr:hypothetical protein [Bacteriovoracaceae bacterium]
SSSSASSSAPSSFSSYAGNEEMRDAGEGSKSSLANALVQMQEKLQEETPPEDPLYEISGRGLVYNCVGQHWACVDRDVYFQCQELKHWTEEHQKPLRCYPANVYISESDCVTVQVYNINKLIRPEQCPRP